MNYLFGNTSSQGSQEDNTPFFEQPNPKVSIFDDPSNTQSAFHLFNYGNHEQPNQHHHQDKDQDKSIINQLDIFEREDPTPPIKHKNRVAVGGKEERPKHNEMRESRFREEPVTKQFKVEKLGSGRKDRSSESRIRQDTNFSFMANPYSQHDSFASHQISPQQIQRDRKEERCQQKKAHRYEEAKRQERKQAKKDNQVKKQWRQTYREEAKGQNGYNSREQPKPQRQHPKQRENTYFERKEEKKEKKQQKLEQRREEKKEEKKVEKQEEKKEVVKKEEKKEVLKKEEQKEEKKAQQKKEEKKEFGLGKELRKSELTREDGGQGGVRKSGFGFNLRRSRVEEGGQVAKSSFTLNLKRSRVGEDLSNKQPSDVKLLVKQTTPSTIASSLESRLQLFDKTFLDLGIRQEGERQSSVSKSSFESVRDSKSSKGSLQFTALKTVEKEKQESLGLKDRLKGFGLRQAEKTEKLQIKSITNRAPFNLKSRISLKEQAKGEEAKNENRKVETKEEDMSRQGGKESREFLREESGFRVRGEEGWSMGRVGRPSDFSKYMVQLIELMQQSEHLKSRCNTVKGIFRETANLSNSISGKISKATHR